MKKMFTDSDIDFLMENYSSKGSLFCSIYLGFSPSQIIRKAAYLGLKRCFVNADGTKTCGKCLKNKPLNQFHKRNLVNSGVSSRCKDCSKDLQKAYWKNPEIKAKYNKNRRLKFQNSPQFKIRVCFANRIRDAIKLNKAKKSKSSIALLGCSIDTYKDFLELRFSKGMSWDNYGKVWEIDHIRPCASFDLTDPKQQIECFNYRNTQPLFSNQNRSKGAKIAY